MRRELSFAVTALILCGLFLIQKTETAWADIVINEIGAYEASGYEWIEIWNSGSDPVDMIDWKFYENSTNHSLSVSSTNSIIDPNEYAAICQDEENFLFVYPYFSGSILDSSWGSLNESGEELGLKNNSGSFVLQFSYPPASNYSLELADPFSSSSDPSNWREHSASNTLGYINSNFFVATSSPTSTLPEATSTPPIATSASDLSLWFSLKINEFVSDPESGNEWVELYQTATGSLDLAGGVICDSRETSCKPATGTIEGLGFALVDLLSSSFLNNDGDSVILKNASGTIIDRVDYISPYAPAKGQSLARNNDGIDSDRIDDWAITTSITSGGPNIIITPPAPGGGGGGGGTPEPVVYEPEIEEYLQQAIRQGVIINEIYPNPAGSDEEGEYIEIINTSTEQIDLAGWKLADSVRQFSLSGLILPGQIIYWPRTQTKIALNNSTAEQVKLISPDGNIAESIKYSGARENESYARDSGNQWHWTTEPTPGEANIFSQPDTGGIIWKIIAPTSGRLGEMLVFDAEDSADERGGLISFIWDFDDGVFGIGGEVLHAYSTTGTFVITLYASSSAGSVSSKKIKIDIGELLSQSDTKIQINEILSDPLDDETREFVEIANPGLLVADISGWSLKNKTKKFSFPENTIIGPGQILVFFRRVTGFVLNNQGDQVELINRDGDIIDLIKIGQAKEGMSYAFFENEWQWTGAPTPGLPNIKNVYSPLSTIKISSQKASFVYKKLSIFEARAEDVGSAVIVRGSVSVLPGIFGVQYFYIGDSQSGIQIYSYKKDFPELKIGDYIEVKGEISEAQGIKRIKTKDRSAIDILATEKPIMPSPVDIENLAEEDFGRLVILSGEITEAKSNYLYLDNTAGEIKIYFKKGAGIKQQYKEGEQAEVIGVAEATGSEIQVWPREQKDITLLDSISEVAGEKISSVEKKKSISLSMALVGAISALVFGFVVKAKGVLVLQKIKNLFISK